MKKRTNFERHDRNQATPTPIPTVLFLALLVTIASSGCVIGIDEFTIEVWNQTESSITVHLSMTDAANQTLGFETTLQIAASSLAKLVDTAPWRANFTLNVTAEDGPSGWDTIPAGFTACGSCIWEVYVSADRIRFGNSVLD